MDVDLALQIEHPTTPIESSSSIDRMNYKKWEHSNRMSLMIIKRGIPEEFRGAVSGKLPMQKNSLLKLKKKIDSQRLIRRKQAHFCCA